MWFLKWYDHVNKENYYGLTCTNIFFQTQDITIDIYLNLEIIIFLANKNTIEEKVSAQTKDNRRPTILTDKNIIKEKADT